MQQGRGVCAGKMPKNLPRGGLLRGGDVIEKTEMLCYTDARKIVDQKGC